MIARAAPTADRAPHKDERLTIGVIADTHGLLRPAAVAALRGAALILHAGDIGGPDVLTALQRVAPVVAVRGNNDRGAWAAALPAHVTVEVGAARILLLHDLKELTEDPHAAGYRIVVSGHSHKPLVEEPAGVLYLNPGSAGPRRFKLPISLARLTINGARVRVRLIDLPADAAASVRAPTRRTP